VRETEIKVKIERKKNERKNDLEVYI